MYPARVRYHRATNTQDVLDVLAELGSGARVLAGGATLIPQLKYRDVQPQPDVVVDISWLDELWGTEINDSQVLVNPMTRHDEAATDQVLADGVPAARDVGMSIGDQQIRNMGTVGGGLVAVEPTGDWGPCLIACGGWVVVQSVHGQREISSTELFEGPLRSALRPDELLTRIVFPRTLARSGSAHVKFLVRAVTAQGGCTVALTLDARQHVQRVGVGLGGLTPVPVAVPEVSSVLEGQPVAAASVAEARNALVKAIEPHADSRTSAAHRRSIAGSLFVEALTLAHARAAQGVGHDDREDQ